MILPGNTTKTLPQIIYDEVEGSIHIKGRSVDCEVASYFGEFLDYLKDCLDKKPSDIKIIIDLEYFSTKTAKLIMDFFEIIRNKVVKQGFNADIEWIYEEGDDDMKEAGEDYESLSKLKIKLVEKSE